MTERERTIADDPKVQAALLRREQALVELWIQVMHHFDLCPDAVKEAWVQADRRSRESMRAMLDVGRGL